MRAGLLSQPQVIQKVNEKFVSVMIPYFELELMAKSGNVLAKEIMQQFQTPLVLAFYNPEGKFLTKLSSLKELNQVHPDTTKRPEAPQHHSPNSEENNARVFLNHVRKHFPDQGQR